MRFRIIRDPKTKEFILWNCTWDCLTHISASYMEVYKAYKIKSFYHANSFYNINPFPND